MEVGFFSDDGYMGNARPGPQMDASEVEFLRREVLDLERVIKSLHASRSADTQVRAQSESRMSLALEVNAQQREADIRELEATRAALATMRVDHDGAVVVAAARDMEVRVLTVELRILAIELLDAEAEREAAREAEGSALSIARSYRGFAAQGASRLDELRSGIEMVQSRLLQRVARLQAGTSSALRTNALRVLCGWRVARGLGFAMARWRLLVVSAEQREAVAQRLETAYRHRDIEEAAARVQLANERRQTKEAADAARSRMDAELREAALERERASASASAEVERRKQADRRAEKLSSQLEGAQKQGEQARQAAAAELAACRAELTEARRAAATAREGERTATATAASLRAELDECSRALAKAKADAAAESEERAEEARTRAFLERVLRDERQHATRRAEEAAALAALVPEHTELGEVMHRLSSELATCKFELNNSLLGRALAGSTL